MRSIKAFLVYKVVLSTKTLEELLLPSWAPSKHSWFGQACGNQRQYKSAPLQERKMIDRRRIRVKGGDGGDGCTSFRKSRHARHGEADGGRGGRGGDVIFKCSEEYWDFGHLQPFFVGCEGGNGSSKKKVGSRGIDKVVLVPKGTVIHLISGQIPSLQESYLKPTQLHDDEIDAHGYIGSYEEKPIINVDDGELLDPIQEQASLKLMHLQDDESEAHGYLESDKDKAIVDVNDGGLSDPVQECNENGGDWADESGVESENTESDESSGIEGIESEESKQAEREVVKKAIAELIKVGEVLTVAFGGEGGRGNAAMARGRGAKRQLPSKEHEKGHPGTDAFLILELKTIADVGFVGAPNAGKSTLLGAISRAKPKVGHYAFTTLRPNLGKLEFEDFYSITVADIPGLIKGAHMNVGLGHDFLRHIERTTVLAYVVDLSASVGHNKGSPPWVQYEDLKFELEMYQPGLSEKPSVVVATKLDEKGAKEMLEEMKSRLPSAQILPVCALLEQGIHELRLALRDVVTAQKA
ncbi:hypothetical protein L7F22_033549 [Adiantum nelumboides]|nr:hypothetical protein [Adiantum nelumboides]